MTESTKKTSTKTDVPEVIYTHSSKNNKSSHQENMFPENTPTKC